MVKSTASNAFSLVAVTRQATYDTQFVDETYISHSDL